MSCTCGATRPAECPTLVELAGDVAGDGAIDKAHRALWCLLHPFQCRRDPKTGRPIPAVADLVLLGVVVFAWWKLTEE